MTKTGPVLIVDDEENIREVLKLYLSKEGFQVETAADGEEALAKLREAKPQLIVLDLMLPKIDGWEVCRQIRRESSVPIIMLTAKGEEMDRVLGLELGADDYVTKPFSPRELVARIRAVLRRTANTSSESSQEPEILTFPGLVINYPSHKVLVNSKEVELTRKEFELLWFLARNEKRLFTREQLLENVWGYEYAGDTRTLNTHIQRLREKLGEPCSRYIITVWGIGYKFEVTD
ncbi:MAG: response regulator [Thermacetogeniaceae bacterium]